MQECSGLMGFNYILLPSGVVIVSSSSGLGLGRETHPPLSAGASHANLIFRGCKWWWPQPYWNGRCRRGSTSTLISFLWRGPVISLSAFFPTEDEEIEPRAALRLNFTYANQTSTYNCSTQPNRSPHITVPLNQPSSCNPSATASRLAISLFLCPGKRPAIRDHL